MLDIDGIDISIMSILVELDSTSPLFSTKTKDITEKLNRIFKYNVSYPTSIRRLQKLKEKEYISESFKFGNSRSYYISEKGIDFMQSIIQQENNYGINIEIVDNEVENNELEGLDNE